MRGVQIKGVLEAHRDGGRQLEIMLIRGQVYMQHLQRAGQETWKTIRSSIQFAELRVH